MTLEEAKKNVHDAVDELIQVITEDEEISDEELQTIVDLEQEIADKFSNVLSEHGVEIGDERVD